MGDVDFEGPFAPGLSGTLEHVSGRRSAFELGDVRPGLAFTVVSSLPGARLRIEHEVVGAPEVSRVTQRAVIDGALGRLWALFLGRQLSRDITAGAEATASEAAKRV
jgi:hypothetical protein